MMKYTHLLLILSVFLTPSPLFAQKTIFVNQNANGLQTGQSWIDAYTDLQQAIGNAVHGDTIWVAQGTYKPGPERFQSFAMVSGVQLYGGFSGFETDLAQRNWNMFETILSADIGEPGVDTDNNYHVLTGFGADSLTVVDGFTIRDGYSVDYESYPGNEGGGIQLFGSPDAAYTNPRISNCRFINNQAQKGGAIYVGWFYNAFFGYHPVNPSITHCSFENNKSIPLNGGALAWEGPCRGGDTIKLQDCTFRNSSALYARGGHVYFGTIAGTALHLSDCLFDRDTSGYASLDFLLNQTNSTPTYIQLEQCIFRNKGGNGAVGALHIDDISSNKIQCDVVGCVFDSNNNLQGKSVFDIRGNPGSSINLNFKNTDIVNNVGSKDALCNIFIGNIHANFENCKFLNNTSTPNEENHSSLITWRGGTNYLAETTFKNCLFANNAGGLEFFTSSSVYYNTEITNCTFYENKKYVFAKSYYPSFSQAGNPYYNRIKIRNSIIWETNEGPIYSNVNPYGLETEQIFVENSLLRLESLGSFPAAGNKYVKSPLFVDSLAGDFRLRACSPAVNAGNNAFIDSLSTDLAGTARILFGKVDMGAFESTDTCKIVSTNNPSNIQALQIAPNPAHGLLQFQLPEGTLAMHLEVINASGKIVFQKNDVHSQSIDLGNQSPGIYWIRMRTNAGVFVGKWIRL
jgi:hypothetical protein